MHGAAAAAWLAMPAGVPGSIHYTTDGSTPTASGSPRFTSAFPLHTPMTVVAARAFGVAEGTATPLSVFRFFAVGARQRSLNEAAAGDPS